MPLKLHIIITSTRPGRVGPIFGQWFHEQAVAHGTFEASLVDLASFDLPVLDEPHHPRMQKYEHAHTKAWAASVAAADAFVFVTPEYNYGTTPALVNALSYLAHEWAYKPAGFVSYGGISGGLRGVQSIKPILTTLKIMPIPEAVPVPMAGERITAEKTFDANDLHRQGARIMLDELARWAGALKGLRG